MKTLSPSSLPWEVADLDARYERNIPALTEAECDLLRSKKVLVVGCGGLGGYILEHLARIGIGSIRCVDGDRFDRSNLNRQLLCTEETLGKYKAGVAAARLANIVDPSVSVDAVCAFLDDTNVDTLIDGCDVVIDALDNIPARKLLAKACEKAGIPYVYGAISGWVAQAALSLPGDKLVETLYPEDVVAQDKSVLSFTPALCASLQVSLCIKHLVGRPVKSGTVYYYDLLNQEYETIDLV